MRSALESERAAEKEFVERARQSEKAPRGWPAALVMFHIGMWRERLRNAFLAESEGRSYTQPGDADEINDAELPNGIGTPLSDAAARSDHLLGEIIELYTKLGERPFTWYRATSTSEAVLGNSYMHPRVHLYEYLRDNGDLETANRLFEDAEAEMRGLPAPALQLGAAIYNLACARVNQKRIDDALALLAEAFSIRPDLKTLAATDTDLEPLRDDARLQEMLKS